jgi:hypothetical protein
MAGASAAAGWLGGWRNLAAEHGLHKLLPIASRGRQQLRARLTGTLTSRACSNGASTASMRGPFNFNQLLVVPIKRHHAAISWLLSWSSVTQSRLHDRTKQHGDSLSPATRRAQGAASSGGSTAKGTRKARRAHACAVLRTRRPTNEISDCATCVGVRAVLFHRAQYSQCSEREVNEIRHKRRQ